MSPFWPGAVAHAVATTIAATTVANAQAAQLLLDTTSTVRAARALEQGGSLPGGDVGGQPASTVATASTSTGMPNGNSPAPIADRAWRPASPQTARMSSLNPLMAAGV